MENFGLSKFLASGCHDYKWQNTQMSALALKLLTDLYIFHVPLCSLYTSIQLCINIIDALIVNVQ